MDNVLSYMKMVIEVRDDYYVRENWKIKCESSEKILSWYMYKFSCVPKLYQTPKLIEMQLVGTLLEVILKLYQTLRLIEIEVLGSKECRRLIKIEVLVSEECKRLI